MINTDSAEFCPECGEQSLKKIGDINSTRLFICLDCFSEQHEFIGFDSCEHEYDEKSGSKCINCGEEE
jgi:hypothetical protein